MLLEFTRNTQNLQKDDHIFISSYATRYQKNFTGSIDNVNWK